MAVKVLCFGDASKHQDQKGFVNIKSAESNLRKCGVWGNAGSFTGQLTKNITHIEYFTDSKFNALVYPLRVLKL